ncbi:hypothetical protein [Erythrobacter sp. EC-HK427]|uniref:hypothetical protein n=1 Tax=Erythrobacter sp. EC-HK427 TaxID=2038396 RepID=UPI001255F437|nr:hypothetical protein [Erythrobacter sp. EC-HK427]VVT03190.1 conserved hypothetical protein [Erythrobacter sp. EC-HK427]
MLIDHPSANVSELPHPPFGQEDLAYHVLANGELAILRTASGFHRRLESFERLLANPRAKKRKIPRVGTLYLSTFDGHAESAQLELAGLGFTFTPLIDRFADGSWLLVDSRCSDDTQNAVRLDNQGSVTGRFHLGDGIAHMACHGRGGIYCGYFDEGIYGGWPDASGRWPVASGGITRFDDQGRDLWRFNDHCLPEQDISDCYAMGLQDGALWACYYTNFPIVRIADETVRHWDSPVKGGSAIAVSGNRVLLAGGYGDDADRIALLELRHKDAVVIGTALMSSNARSHIQGRDGVLHLVDGRRWCRLAVKDW